MNSYPGSKETLVKLTITWFVFFTLMLVTILVFKAIFVKILILAFLLPTLNLIYQGMIVEITLSDTKLSIKRLFHTTHIAIKDIAFCAIHGLQDEKFLIYCFVRTKRFGKERVSGIKGKHDFNTIVKMLMDDDGKGTTNLDINFHVAKKVPASFVNNSEDLKLKLLKLVDAAHSKLL